MRQSVIFMALLVSARIANSGEEGIKTTAPPVLPASASTSCTCDPAERQLLQRLHERQLQLDERDRKITAHEAVLGKIEAELAGRLQVVVADVQRLEDHVKPALAEKQTHDQQKADALLNALATLPARKASAIITKAEPEIASMLLGQLGPDKSAAILAVMEPAAAAALVQRMVKPGAKGNEATHTSGRENQQ